MHLVLRRRRIEVVQRANVAAHTDIVETGAAASRDPHLNLGISHGGDGLGGARYPCARRLDSCSETDRRQPRAHDKHSDHRVWAFVLGAALTPSSEPSAPTAEAVPAAPVEQAPVEQAAVLPAPQSLVVASLRPGPCRPRSLCAGQPPTAPAPRVTPNHGWLPHHGGSGAWAANTSRRIEQHHLLQELRSGACGRRGPYSEGRVRIPLRTQP